jgi:predicted ATPase
MCLNGSRQQPLIVEVEDLHWLDASSDEWLTALVEQMMGVPILVLVTYRPGYRPGWIDKSYATQVALQPLTPQESLQVVQAVLPTAVPTAPLVPRLLATGEGNPFFLEELAQTVVEQGAEASTPTVPDTVQAVLLARIDRLPASAKSLLQAAAVIGKDVALPWLQAITDVPEAAMSRDLRHLQAAEFLYAAHTQTTLVYTFKHVLTQEVTYQSLLRPTRQQYHARIAQVLEAQFPEVAETQPELLAQHYTVAGQGALAIPYWQRAGQRATERSANVEAISHFTTGLELLKTLPAGPERIEQELTLQLAIGAPLMMLQGDTAPEVEHTYTRAYELAQQLGESPQQFSVLLGLWVFYFSRARLQRAQELAEQCFTMAQHLQDVCLRQDAYLALGSTLLHLGNHIAARASLEQGIALYDPQQSRILAFSRWANPGVVCLSRLAWVLWMLGYPEQAVARSGEALALAQDVSHTYSIVFALHFAGLLRQSLRDIQVVQEQAEEEIAFSNAHGFVEWLEGGMMLRGWALAQQGAVAEGIAQLRQGLDAWLTRATELGKTQILARLAEAYEKAGDIVQGLRVLDEALAAVRHNAERHYEAELYRLKGELLLQARIQYPECEGGQPQVAEVEACFRQALDIAHNQQTKSLELRAAMSLARLWQTQGKRAEAYEMLTEIYGWFTEGFATPDLQEAQALLAALQ